MVMDGEFTKKLKKYLIMLTYYKIPKDINYVQNIKEIEKWEKSNLCHIAKVCCIEDMQFHSDWNWIHEVIEKIQCYRHLIITRNHCEIHFYPDDNMNINISHRFTKEAVVQAIYQFLQWWNENNK